MRMTIKRQRILVISDLQIPLHHEKAVLNLRKLVRREKFDMVLNSGDELDFTAQSKWTKGTPAEFTGKLHEERELAQDILWELNTSDVIRSNHTDRLYHTILRGAPSLIGLPELEYAKFMDFDSLNIRFHKKPFEFIKGWNLIHGDEGRLSQVAAMTAINNAKSFGANIIQGHTHRLGLSAYSTGLRGDYSTLWGFEVGNLMNKKKASYLGAGAANWQMGFGIIEVHGKNVTCIPVPVNQDGSFTIYGKIYS